MTPRSTGQPAADVYGASMDEGTIKISNPKCRLYWCLIEFIDWRYSQSCWYFFFDSSCELLPFYLLSDPPTPPPLPKVNVQYTCTLYRLFLGMGGGGGI